jgi:uncharacterized coiled-coil protein SlyX
LLGLEASKAEYENLYQQAFNNLKLLSVNTEKLQALTQKLQSRRFKNLARTLPQLKPPPMPSNNYPHYFSCC